MNAYQLIYHAQDRAGLIPEDSSGVGIDEYAGGGKVAAVEQAFEELSPGLKKMIHAHVEDGLPVDHPAVKTLAETFWEHPDQYPSLLDYIAEHHDLTQGETSALHTHVLNQAHDMKTASDEDEEFLSPPQDKKDPLEQVEWEPGDYKMGPYEDPHSYTPSGSKILTGVDMDALGEASEKNAAKLPPQTSQADRIVRSALALPEDSDYKSYLQHFIRGQGSDQFGKYGNRSIVNPEGGGYYTVGKGRYGTNDGAFLSLMKQYGFDPMLSNPEFNSLERYTHGHLSGDKETTSAHEALNGLIHQYGLDLPSDTTLYKGMSSQGGSWMPQEQWHNPTSFSTDPNTSAGFSPGGSGTMLHLHGPGHMLPNPQSGESELIMPGGAAGRVNFLDRSEDPTGRIIIHADRPPFSEYAEGGLSQAQQQKMGNDSSSDDPTGPNSLKSLAAFARGFGGPQHADDRARLLAGVAQNFYGLDSQGRASLLRSHQPGVIDQFVAMPGGMAHLAGLVAQAGAASKWNPLHTMAPNLYDNAASWLAGPHATSDAAAQRLEQLHQQVSQNMNVPEASGLKQHVLDAAGMLATPIPGGALAKYSPKLQRLLEIAGPVAPPTLKRYVGDSAMFGGINDAPEALTALKHRLEEAQSEPDPEAQEQAPDAYGEGGEVLKFLKSMIIHVPHDVPGTTIEEKTKNVIAQGFAEQRRGGELLDSTNTDLQPEHLNEALSGHLNNSITPEDLDKANAFMVEHKGSTDWGDGMLEHHMKVSAPPDMMRDYQNALSDIE